MLFLSHMLHSKSTVFTWLNAAPLIVAALEGCHARFKNYALQRRFQASSGSQFRIVVAPIFDTKVI